MNIKKISAAVLAAAILTVGAPVTGIADPMSMAASAAEEQKLLSFNINEVFPNGTIRDLGIDGYYYVSTNRDGHYGEYIDKIIRIDFEAWRKTGKFTYTEIKSDIDLSKYSDLSAMGDAVKLGKNIMKIDESTDRLVKVYETTESDITFDGYGFSYSNSAGVYKYSVTAPDGTKTEGEITCEPSQTFRSNFISGSNEYICLVNTKVPGSKFTCGYETVELYELYGIKKDGTYDLIDETISNGFIYCFNCCAWLNSDYQICVFSYEDGSLHRLTQYEFNFDHYFKKKYSFSAGTNTKFQLIVDKHTKKWYNRKG